MTTAHTLIGRTLAGRFRITKLLGEGAMATVLRGEQDVEPREVAIKIMRPELGIDPSFPKRFRREAKTASLLQHPNTVRILDFGADGDTLYIVMELLRGRDLFDTLQTEKRFSESRAARLMIQVCKALSAAHGQGIIHRDLKPENVWLEPDPIYPGHDRVKVLDFGIAKLLDPEIADKAKDGSAPPSSHLVTMAGTVVGTPEYMSPEQCKGEQVGPRSDVYSCGVILYLLVTGRAPFVAESAIEVTIKHVHEPPDPPSKLRAGLNPVLEAIILTAMAKSPDDRTKSAAALGEALEAILPKLSNDASAPAPARPSTPAAKTVVSPVALQTEPVKPKPLERTLASEMSPEEHPAAIMAQIEVRAAQAVQAAHVPPAQAQAPPAGHAAQFGHAAMVPQDRARANLRTARATSRSRVGWFVLVVGVVVLAATVIALVLAR
jgi:eukaryotic-like serine/threonine-protein kinase